MADSLFSANCRLLETGLFADFEIHCGERVWRVHKAILGSRSEYFRAALSRGWLEAETGCINLDEMDPDELDLVINFIYTERLPIRFTDVDVEELYDDQQRIFVTSVKLWIHGDYFKIGGLEKVALDRVYSVFSEYAVRLWTFRFLDEPYTYERPRLPGPDTIEIFVNNLDEGLRSAYALPPAAARPLQLALLACALVMREYLTADVLCGLLAALPDFAADVRAALVRLHFDTTGLWPSSWPESLSEEPGPRGVLGPMRARDNGALAERETRCARADCRRRIAYRPGEDWDGADHAEGWVTLNPLDFSSGAAWCWHCGVVELPEKMRELVRRLT